jgi:deoxyribonuclease IV
LEAYNNGAKIVQFFVKKSPKNKMIYYKLKDFLILNKIKCVIHASYTINLSNNWDKYSWWILEFIEEIKLAKILGAISIVVHLGKQMSLSKEESINNMYTSLLYIYHQTIEENIKILLETSSGQGTELCYELPDLALIYRKFSKHINPNIANRFGICLDTCHIFSAGYNIKNKKMREIYFSEFNELIGLQHIKLIHLNDSKVPCKSKVDRHENLDDGYIGIKALLIIVKVFEKHNIPIILETPYKKIYDDLRKINI